MASALSIDPSLFGPAAISDETNAFNQSLMDIMAKGPKWYEVSHHHQFDSDDVSLPFDDAWVDVYIFIFPS